MTLGMSVHVQISSHFRFLEWNELAKTCIRDAGKPSKMYSNVFCVLQVPSGASSRPISPSSSATLGAPGSRGSSFLAIDFNIPASPLGCLDTSAARHRIAINPRKQKGFTNKNQQHPQVSFLQKTISGQKETDVNL